MLQSDMCEALSDIYEALYARIDELADREKRKTAAFILLFEIMVKREQAIRASLKPFDSKDMTLFEIFEFHKRVVDAKLDSDLDTIIREVDDFGKQWK